MVDVEQLNDRLGIPGIAEVIAGNGNLPAVDVRMADGTRGLVYLHGAHVAGWRPGGADEQVLWLSDQSVWQADKPIRGGVPICFPWFGPKKDDPQAPAHGFVRLKEWELESITQDGAGVTVTLTIRSSDATKKLWPHDFTLKHRVTFGRELVMALELTNTGAQPFTAEEAQHTYFRLGDVRTAKVTGLDGVQYIDKVDGMKEKTQHGDITITGETDRVYLDTTVTVTVVDAAKKRKITVAKEHSHTSVVWNPWVAKSKAMADFGDEEWPGMICVETCNVAAFAVKTAPGQTQIMTSRIRVEPL